MFVHSLETEKELRSRYRDIVKPFTPGQSTFHLPDGRVVLERNGTPFRSMAIELELTIKSRARYRKLFSDLHRVSDWDVTLYVLKDAASLKRFSQLLESLYQKDVYTSAFLERAPVFCITLAEILGQSSAWTLSARDEIYPFSQLLCADSNLKPYPKPSLNYGFG